MHSTYKLHKENKTLKWEDMYELKILKFTISIDSRRCWVIESEISSLASLLHPRKNTICLDCIYLSQSTQSIILSFQNSKSCCKFLSCVRTSPLSTQQAIHMQSRCVVLNCRTEGSHALAQLPDCPVIFPVKLCFKACHPQHTPHVCLQDQA